MPGYGSVAVLAAWACLACGDRRGSSLAGDAGAVVGGGFSDARSDEGGFSGGRIDDGGGVVSLFTPRIIFDTDMGPDVDDAGALAVLHALADNREIELLAVVISTTDDDGTPAISFVDAVDTYYGRPDLPIGLYNGPRFAFSDKYTGDVASNPAKYPHDLGPTRDQVPEATALYRQVLANEPDSSVTIVCVGPMNNLRALLSSQPDSSSSLDGTELVSAKVRLLVQMGGDYPSGSEFNFVAQTVPGTTKAVIESWPTPIVFSGFSIGGAILTGASLADTPDKNPVRRAYELYTGMLGGIRQSWDVTAALSASRGASPDWSLSAPGINLVDEAGNNVWQDSPGGRQAYLQVRADPAEVTAELDSLMSQAPKH